MDLLNDFKFVLTHSAYLIPAVLTFALIGFLIGYFTWAKYARQLKQLKAGAPDLKPEVSKSVPSATKTTTPISAPKADAGPVATKAPATQVRNDRVTPEPPKQGGIGLPQIGLAGGAIAGLDGLAHKFKGEEDKLDVDEDLGLVYKERPDQVDDLTELEGINSLTSAKLNDRGIYTFKQLEAMDDNQRAKFASRFNLPDIKWDSWKSKLALGGVVAGVAGVGAGITGFGGALKNAAGNAVDGAKELVGMDVDPEIGNLYKERPTKVDDLTQLEGINATTADQLNQSGIYTYKQLEDLDDSQRAKFASRFNLPDIEWHSWKSKLALGGVTAGVGAAVASGGTGIASAGKTLSETGDSIANKVTTATPPEGATNVWKLLIPPIVALILGWIVWQAIQTFGF